MKKLFKKKSSKAVRRRTALANKTMLSIEALEKRVLLAADFGADFQAVSSGDEIWIEARGTQFQDRFTVVEVDHKIKIKIDFEIDAKNDGIGDFGQFILASLLQLVIPTYLLAAPPRTSRALLSNLVRLSLALTQVWAMTIPVFSIRSKPLTT